MTLITAKTTLGLGGDTSIAKVKLPLIKQFLGEKLKLKGFLI